MSSLVQSKVRVPHTIFIIPYRDRLEDKERFMRIMPKYFKELPNFDETNYKIFFAHQCDKRPFNRGAMKNIGFLAVKKLYPQYYKDITFIFHDVDTLPKEQNMFPYKTTHGVVEHYYGLKFALGGVFTIKGGDFEKTEGFPNFWGWGLEDNLIQTRCLKAGLKIDRSVFYKMRDQRVFRSNDGVNRLMSKRDSVVFKFENPDNMNIIKNMEWNIHGEMINISSFEPQMNWKDQEYFAYDIRKGGNIATPQGYHRRVWSLKSMYNN